MHKKYAAKFNDVIKYLEINLAEEISLEELANIACISKFHFHRLFKLYSGESIGSYKKRIRLENAATQLRYTERKIEDIAFTAGYESISAFSSAFKKHFNGSPSEFRKNTITPKKITKEDMEKTVDIGKPEIKFVPEQHILYFQHHGYKDADKIGQGWRDLWAYVNLNNLKWPDIKAIGIPHDDPSITADEHCRFDLALTMEKPPSVSFPYQTKDLKGGKYAVFTHIGDYNNLSAFYNAIFSTWLLNSSYELRDVPIYSYYVNSIINTPVEQLVTKVHVPVK